MKIPTALFLLLSCSAFAAGPGTLDNDDSCDVIVAPAATLLLPYFEVDLSNASGETTLFTVTNVTQLPQIARVTVWTDRSFPVLDFNIFLTGYDVQSINLFDVFARGRIAEPGTTSESEVGARSLGNDENPLLDISDCDRLAVFIPDVLLKDIQTALVAGRAAHCSNTAIGGQHANAIGYLTIDVVQRCGISLPTDAGYFANELLYDNVLTGDYQQVNSSKNSAQAGSMVHIRAIPEGGGAGVHATNVGRTFYSNYQNGGTGDRRQPLPSTFAARWIGGNRTQLDTSFKIWREGIQFFGVECAVTSNGILGMTEVVRFDENENPSTFAPCQICSPPFPSPTLPATSRAQASSMVFPPNPDAAVGGWMYMNFDHDAGFPFASPTVASQNWVVVSMEAAGRYSADFDAASLGNGCSLPAAVTDPNGGNPAIVPAPNAVNAVFASSPKTLNNDDSCDIKVTPAATLLLPYFEVDITNREGETTLLTITNVTALPRIARLTIWTDRAYPVLSFNVFLTGYDVQSINLFDVVASGHIARPSTGRLPDPGRRSKDNDANPLLDVANCDKLPDQLPDAVLADLRSALTIGRVSSCGTAGVGNAHANAVGYLTIDVVKNCASRMPIDPEYFPRDLLYDNALIGDYQQVNSAQSSAQSNAMVHIRAIPEGGAAGSSASTFPRTFYSRLQGGGVLDRRQPLPSTFAAHWISGGSSSFQTNFKIWREGTTGANAGCAVSSNAAINVVDIVRFDEEENPTALSKNCNLIILCPVITHTLPAAARVPVESPDLPANTTSSVAGWMYLNLDDGMTQTPVDRPSQSWVIVSMRAEGRYSGDFDATALGNGCSPPAVLTNENGNAPVIAPAPNANPGS